MDLNQLQITLTTSWRREDRVNGYKSFKLFILQIPPMVRGAEGKPQIAVMPTVIAEATLEVPNIEIAKYLQIAIADVIRQQPPEILIPTKGN